MQPNPVSPTSQSDQSSDTAFVGRQPIFRPDQSVHTYELLFRSGTQNAAVIIDGDQATASVLINTFTDTGLAEIIKIEDPAIPNDELPSHVQKLRELGAQTILAEKVETQEDFDLCKSLGCDLFQGYFVSRPQVLS